MTHRESPKSYEFTLLRTCAFCGDDLPLGLARCRNPGCARLRPEFESHGKVVVPRTGTCTWCGAVTDVKLPGGPYLWAPYFLDAVRAGWLDTNYRFTEMYRQARARKAQS